MLGLASENIMYMNILNVQGYDNFVTGRAGLFKFQIGRE